MPLQHTPTARSSMRWVSYERALLLTRDARCLMLTTMRSRKITSRRAVNLQNHRDADAIVLLGWKRANLGKKESAEP